MWRLTPPKPPKREPDIQHYAQALHPKIHRASFVCSRWLQKVELLQVWMVKKQTADLQKQPDYVI